MPEGHVIHRTALDHRRLLVGRSLRLSSPQGRFACEAALLDGDVLDAVEAYGKHLVYRWRRAPALHVHLGLYGRFRQWEGLPPSPRGAVRLRAVAAVGGFDLNGPNRCELLDGAALERLLERIGADPLRSDADPESVWNRLRGSRAAVGSLLLNQRVVAGIGNIYRSELLFLLGIHPERQGRNLTRGEFDRLWHEAVRLLRLGERHGRIVTAEGAGDGKERLAVYKKDRCPQCAGPVSAWPLGGRMVFACPACQR